MSIKRKMKLIFIIVITVLLARPVTAQANSKAFNKIIFIRAKEVRIDSLLKLFSKQTGFEFSFNSNTINSSKKLPVPKQNYTLSQWLAIFKQKLGTEYKLVGNHIILTSKTNRVNIKRKSNPLKSTVLITTLKKKEINTASKSQERGAHTRPAQKETHTSIKRSVSDTTTHASLADQGRFPGSTVVNKAIPENVKQEKAIVDSNVHKVNDIKPPRQQSKRNISNDQSIQLIGGYSRHGSGDMKGIVFGTAYTSYLTKKLSLSYNMRATINSSKDEFIVNNAAAGTRTDASIRYTTAGVQLGVDLGWSILKSERHDLKLSLGAFGRYQSASNGSDGYSTYNPQTTGVPTILIGYDNRTPQETFAIGAIFQFQYLYAFGDKVYIGILPGFQTDTNGDAIPQFAFTIGKRL